VNRDVKIGIVASIAIFLILVLIWSTRSPKEPEVSSIEEEIVVAKELEPDWLKEFEKEREAIVVLRPPVEVEKVVEEAGEEIPELIEEPLFITEEEVEPEEEAKPEEKVTPVTAPAKRTHIVQKGDSLWKLAEKYYGDASKWRLIQQANKEIVPRTTALRIGLKLNIPEPEVLLEEQTRPSTPESRAQRTYVIKRGDLLWNLAIKFYGDGTKWKIIHDANKKIIPNPTLLPVGKEIVIPEVASGQTVPRST
jgi:nucleoid-associated protein YgaU